MSITRLPIPALFGGVSTQPPAQRYANQVADASNALFDVRNGFSKRPGSSIAFAISGLLGSGDYRLHMIARDSSERYICAYGEGELRVFGLDGTEYSTIFSPNALAYFEANNPDSAELRLVTVADNTIILNTTVAPQTGVSPHYKAEKQHYDASGMMRTTPSLGSYHQALGDTETYPSGYWQYMKGPGTFPTMKMKTVVDEKTGYLHYKDKRYGFDIAFARRVLAETNCSYDADLRRLSKTNIFKGYEFSTGDQVYLTAGTGVTAGWHDIEEKLDDSTIVIAPDAISADASDVTLQAIGIEIAVSIEMINSDVASMSDVAREFQYGMQSAGASDALCAWTAIKSTQGYMTITCPFRGENATIYPPTAATAENTQSLDTSDLFSGTIGDYTLTAGTGHPESDTLEVTKRWTRVAAPYQDEARFDADTMPIKMERIQPGSGEDYPTTIKNDSPVSYWRLSDAGASAAADGLRGEYYNDKHLTDYVLTRIDSTVNFDWTTGSPDALIDRNTFSVRWTGYIKPQYSETYTFKVACNDGCRLWVNNTLLIDYWKDFTGVRTLTATIALTADTLTPIKLEYREDDGSASCKLYWSSSSQTEQIIPQARMYSALPTDICVDEIGANDGTYFGDPAIGETGAITNDSNAAVTFDGTDDYINIGTLGDLGSSLEYGVSIEAWFKTTTNDAGTIFHAQNSDDDMDLVLKLNPAGRIVFSFTPENDNEGFDAVTGDTEYEDGEWHHVIASWNPDVSYSDGVHIYLDGVQEDITITSRAKPTSFTDFDADACIGASDSGTPSNFFTGTLDEVCVYPYALTIVDAVSHYRVANADYTVFFYLDTIEWKDRLSGSPDTNPIPDLFDGEKTLTDMCFLRNRFVLAGDEWLIFSVSGDYWNFFVEDHDNLADADPIAAPLNADDVCLVSSITPYRKSLTIFTQSNKQFELNSPEALTYQTAAVTATTAYGTIDTARPAVMGERLYFGALVGGEVQMREYYYSDSEASTSSQEITSHVRGYLPATLVKILAFPNSDALAILQDSSNVLYLWRSYVDNDKRLQSAWGKYTFDSTETLRDVAALDDTIYMLVENAYGFFVATLAVQQEDAETGWEYAVHLDNRQEVTGVHAGGTTTFTLPVSDIKSTRAVLGPDFGDNAGAVVTLSRSGATTATIAGDYSAGEVIVGRPFDLDVTLSRPYLRDQNGGALLDYAVLLKKLVLNHVNTGEYVVRVDQAGRATRDMTFTPWNGDILEVQGERQYLIMGNSKDAVVSIRSTSPKPATITGGEWIVDVTNRSE